MTLATADKDGRPSARIVLLKAADERGFAFFTNYESRKGRELAGNSRATLLFFWAELERQVRVTGAASDAEIRAEIWSLGARHCGQPLEGALGELKVAGLAPKRAMLLRACVRRLQT